jgi:LacI family purine nucleotide synthesis repressor
MTESEKRTKEISGDHRYLYQKIASEIRRTIDSGELQPGMRLPSLDSLAETYGVNRITVRRALTDLRTEGLIHAVPAEGTYVSEPRLKKKPNGLLTIGLVSHVLNPNGFGPYHMEIISGIQEGLRGTDAQLTLMPEGHISDQGRIFDLMVRSGLDGVIYLGDFETATLKLMVEKGPPSILIDCRLRGGIVDAVLADNRAGACDAILHVVENGHSRLACITGTAEDSTTRVRLEGVRDAMADCGLSAEAITIEAADFTREGGYASMQKLLCATARPTAVFCFNDEMASGALQAIHERGDLRVPNDISVIGFDDVSWATSLHPPLTTIRVEKQIMGQLAVRHLLEHLRGETDGEMHNAIITPTRLIVRESTGPAPRQ